jgi:hypothetical protein
MAVSAHITASINANLFTDTDFWLTSTPFLGAYGCEAAFQADNINGQMTRYVIPVSRWATHNPSAFDDTGSKTRHIGQWSDPQEASTRLRPQGGYYMRTSSQVDEVSRFGTVASFSGGFISDGVTLDALSTVDYEPCYGHSTAWPHINNAYTQFRDSDSAHLPQDGSSTISLTGSSYSRSKYHLPSYLIAHIANGGTVGSGNVQFCLEERPTTHIATSPFHALDLSTWELQDITGHPDLCTRAFHIYISRLHFQWNAPTGILLVNGVGYPDGTYAGVDMDLADSRIIDRHPVERVLCESRIRGAARFEINEEYYGFVYGTNASIHSTKMGLHPVLFIDLKAIWPSATKPRIAGVASTPNTVDPKIYFLSESGELAVYDFTVKNGSLYALAAVNSGGGNSLPTESRCSGLSWQGTKLYALMGNHTVNPLNFSEQTPTVGVCEYDTVANTWGPINYSPLNGRLGSRALTEMIPLSNGNLAIVAEKVRQTTMRPDVFRTELGWDNLETQTWGGDGQNKTLIFRLGDSVSANTFLPRFKVRLRRTASGSYNVLKARVARVAKNGTDGSNSKWRGGTISTPLAGQPFDEIVPITFNGGATISLVNSVAEVDTDFIEMALDTNLNDYYIMFAISGSSFGVPYTDTLEVGTSRSIFSLSDLGSITTSPDMSAAHGTQRTHFISKVFNDDAGNFYVNNGNPASGSVGMNWWEWQLMFFNPTTLAWNVSPLDLGLNAGKADNSYWGTGLPYTHLCEVQPNLVLFQANWQNDKLFVVDTTKPLATISNTDITAIGQGTPNSVFVADAVKHMEFLKNAIDNRVVFHYAEWAFANDYNDIKNTYAPDGFNWKGGATTKTQVITSYHTDRANEDTVGYFRKDEMSAGRAYFNYPYNFLTWTSLLSFYVGPTFGVTIPEQDDSDNGSAYGSGKMAYRFTPTYYKWVNSAWTLADTFADATTNAYTVPSTPNTAIPILWGLKVNFGPASGTTFAAGEWHTINATYGFEKFARKARYTMAFFTGKTYNITESRNLSDYAAPSFRLYTVGNHVSLTATGPDTITYNSANTIAVFPKVKAGGGMNDAPIVVTYTGTVTYPVGMIVDGTTVPAGSGTIAPACPDWTSSFVDPLSANTTTFQDGTTSVASSSGEYNDSYQAWMAFAGRAGLGQRFQTNDLGGTPYVQVKLRSTAAHPNGRNLRAYSFTDALGTITKWAMQGSTDGSMWVNLHTVTRTAPSTTGNTFTVTDTATNYLYFRLQVLACSDNHTSIGDVYLFDQPLKSTWDITDISSGGSWPTQGHKFEVDQGNGFFEIAPLWTSAGSYMRSFDRITDVHKFRVTIQKPCNDTTTTSQAWVGDYTFYDYGIPTNHATRLGSNAAAVNTPEKGTYDPECLGIAPDVATLWVDNQAPSLLGAPYNADQSGSMGAVTGWLYGNPLSPGTYKVHPYFGFVFFGRPTGVAGSDGGLLGGPTYVPTGTTLHINYCWGRRV